MKIFKFIILKETQYKKTRSEIRRLKGKTVCLENEYNSLKIKYVALKKEKGVRETGSYCKVCKNGYYVENPCGLPNNYACKLSIPCKEFIDKEQEKLPIERFRGKSISDEELEQFIEKLKNINGTVIQ